MTEICVHCGGKYRVEYNVCANCGAVFGREDNIRLQKVQSEQLIHETKDLLHKESSLRMKIVNRKVKLKALLKALSGMVFDKSGYVNIKVQNIDVSISEKHFNKIIQEEIKDLTACLINANEVLKNFNENLKI